MMGPFIKKADFKSRIAKAPANKPIEPTSK